MTSTRLFALSVTCSLLVGAAIGTSGCNEAKSNEAAKPATTGDGVSLTDQQLPYLKVEPVQQDAGGAAIVTTGRVAYDEDRVARLAAAVTGRVMKVNVRPGDEVKVGTVLAVVHSPDVAAAQANLAQDRAQRVQSDQAMSRAQRLLDSGAGSQREVEEARANAAQTKAAEEKDIATLRVLGNGAAEPNPVYEVRSPIAGTLTERHATLGASAQMSDATPLFVVADLTHLWVLVDIFEQDIGLVQKSAPAEITVPAYPDRVFKGEIAQIGNTVDPTSRTVKVRIAMANSDSALKPEMFARVSLQAVGHSAARVPVSSVLTKAQDTYVFVEDKPQHFLRRQVVLGAREGDNVQVLRGLAAGERIVVQGGLLLDAEMGQRI